MVLRAVATDSSENTGETTISVVVADITPPVISRPSDRAVEASGPLTSVSLGAATASDNVDGEVPVAVDSTGPFAVGTHQVIWTASDSSGNTASAVQTVTVRDTTAPVVSAPADLTVEATGDLTSVSLGQGAAIDTVDGSVVPTASTAGPFTVGTHVVTWQATDSAGNTGSDTQIVTVTQTDDSPPQITPPPDVAVELLHRGRAGDSDVELACLRVRFEDVPGTDLTAPQADGLFDELRLYLDDGSGSFEPGADSLVTTVSTFTGGVETLVPADGDPDVGPGPAFFRMLGARRPGRDRSDAGRRLGDTVSGGRHGRHGRTFALDDVDAHPADGGGVHHAASNSVCASRAIIHSSRAGMIQASTLP